MAPPPVQALTLLAGSSDRADGAAVLVSDAQHAGRNWEATMAANCRGYL